jgi:hypothetical protein
MSLKWLGGVRRQIITHVTEKSYWALFCMPLYTFLHNLLNVLVQIANKMRWQFDLTDCAHWVCSIVKWFQICVTRFVWVQICSFFFLKQVLLILP